MSYIQEFCSFLDQTPTPMHFCQKAREELVKKGFTELKETEVWENIPNKFFVIRDERCIAAFNMHDMSKALIVASHDDSPCFRGKPNTYLQRCGIDQARIAPYGSGIWHTWFDRDLKIAGRLLYKDGDSVKSKLFQSSEAVAIIPSLAIHLNRDLSTAINFNLEDDIMPVLSLVDGTHAINNQSPSLLKAISAASDVKIEDIIDFDIYFVDAQGPVVLGTDQELLSSPRLDDQSCAITSLRAFLEAPDPAEGANIFLSFDSEEIGSRLRTGANSNFFTNILDVLKIPETFGSESLIISADNCHANHPNYPAKNDSNHPINLGDGVAYSWRANYSFATDTSSLQKLNQIQEKCLTALKPAITRNDTSPGRTIGPILSSQLGVKTVDLGIPMLGMHSIHETCAVKDIDTLLNYFSDFYRYLSEKK